MLSYQHEYHAGNHADVLKHICLTLILDSLCKKDKPFTVIDSHSGAGRFNLQDERILKTGEASGGIFRLMQNGSDESQIPQSILHYIKLEKPYFERSLYAGSPEISRLCMREQDHLHLVEKHPAALQNLQNNFQLPLFLCENNSTGSHFSEKQADVRYTIHNEDSYKALAALTPPLVKRGLVLIDPSYEDAEDYIRVEDAVKSVHKKWNTAIIALWYPLLVRRKNETAQMLSALEDNAKLGLNPCESFRSELKVVPAETMTKEDGAHLYGSGMLVINPPWKLKEQMEEVTQYLTKVLSDCTKSENAD